MVKKVVQQPRWFMEVCPYCHRKLGWVDRIMRKTKRFCKCRKCGKRIDERFIFW